MRVGLVACSAGKLDHAAPARELYSSQLFRKASAYAEATCDQWFILSALHVLAAPDEILQPYDVRLGSVMAIATIEWRLRVRRQLLDQLAGESDVQLVVLAGATYRSVLPSLPWPAEIPMQGLGVGQQLGFLTRELRQLGAAA